MPIRAKPARIPVPSSACRTAVDAAPAGGGAAGSAHGAVTASVRVSEDAFIEAVERAKRYIFDGDIMQVVLSQAHEPAYQASPLSLYRALRALNPSPYMFYFEWADFTWSAPRPRSGAAGKRMVTLRPIAGTRPRGASREQDAALERELLADPKERAEHVMLMDLGRNDVGRWRRSAAYA